MEEENAEPWWHKLPTTVMFMSKKGEIQRMPEAEIQKAGVPYCCAYVHYTTKGNKDRLAPRFYKDRGVDFLKLENIPLFLLMVPVEGYPHSVGGIWRYGVRQL